MQIRFVMAAVNGMFPQVSMMAHPLLTIHRYHNPGEPPTVWFDIVTCVILRLGISRLLLGVE